MFGRAEHPGGAAAASTARDREARATSRDGAWPSGKARDFGSRIRRFESSRPNHIADDVLRTSRWPAQHSGVRTARKVAGTTR